MNKLTKLTSLAFTLTFSLAAAVVAPGCSAPPDASEVATAELGGASLRTIVETHELHYPGKGLFFVELSYLEISTGDASVDTVVNRKLADAAQAELADLKNTEGTYFSDWQVKQRVSFNRVGLLSVVQTQSWAGGAYSSALNFDLRRSHGTTTPTLAALLDARGRKLAAERCEAFGVVSDDWALEPGGFRFHGDKDRTALVPYKALAGTYLDDRLKVLAGESGAR